jgi:putative lipoic acid-binding regulatory protein
MGEAHASFHAEVRAVFERHAPGVVDEHITVRPSTRGNYVAITIVIEATGKQQLETLFADLKTLAAVKLVL